MTAPRKHLRVHIGTVAEVEDVAARALRWSGQRAESARRNGDTLAAAYNYANSLLILERFKEAKRLLRKVIPVARRALGAEHDITLSLREDLSRATLDGESSAEEKREALQMLEDVAAVMRRVLGPAHPDTLHAQSDLKFYRRKFPGA